MGAPTERGQANAGRMIIESIGKLHGFAFDAIKEGGSVARGQIAPPEPAPAEKKAENVIDYKAMAARYGNSK